MISVTKFKHWLPNFIAKRRKITELKMAKAKKATVKFQKNKLKGTLERRKKYTKFRQQVNRRKERRNRNQENGKAANPKEEATEAQPETSNAEQANVEDYFCNFSIGSEESLDLSDDEEEDVNGLDLLEAVEDEEMEEKDDSEKEEEEEEEEEEDDDDDDDEDEVFVSDDEEEESGDEDDDEMEDDDSQAVTMEMLSNWSTLAKSKSVDSFKHLLMAFRSIARSDEESTFTYRVSNHKVYKKLVRVTLKSAYPIFSQHLFFTKKAKHPAKTKNWRRLEKVVRLFLNNCVRFLRDLDQDDMLQYILTHLEPCTLYFGCFPKAAREYLRVLLDRWSDNGLSSESRARCYQSIKQFATTAIDTEKNSYLSHCLKGVYLVFAKHATKVTESTLPMIQQMLEEGPDLYTLDQKVSAQHAQVYIHQLSSHLKSAKKQHTAESFKSVYTWQFVSCLDFWANVIGNTCNPDIGTTSPMLSQLQPLVDVSLQTLKMNPVGQFLPLRVHIIRSLIGLIDGTGYFVPLSPFIFEIFSGDVKSKMEPTDLPAFEWDLYLRTPKEYTQTKIYQDAKYQVFYDSIIDFYACFGLSIAFPELAIPVLSKLKEDQKDLKGTRFSKSLRTLIDKVWIILVLIDRN
ncbi:Noc2p family-domain-containing protein [Fennellomyces sp. T-0311]|nr:Noc2p family-domain-containing protein [Fennellomyces sp. T-0311]